MVKLNLGKASEAMNKANKIVSSGKRISNLSDDPVGLTQSLKIRSAISGIDQMGRNITLGKAWLTASESSLNQVQELISQARELSVQMASGTANASQRASASLTVQNILDEVVSLANSETGGRYLFSGTESSSAPFGQDGTYLGNDEPFAVKIGKGATIEVGIDGGKVFGTIIATLTDLKESLTGNDTDGIRAGLERLTGHTGEMSSHISDIGSKLNRMEIKEKIFQNLKIVNSDRLSSIEDADIAEAITDLKAKELAYQASLASSSRVMQESLVDYL